MANQFSPKVKKEFEGIVARYPVREAAMLPTLRLIEREFGHIDAEGMRYCAELLNVPPARVYGVVTFYTHFRRETDGVHVIQVCSTLPCALRGSEALCQRLSERLDIEVGETTPDGKYTLKKVECLALCDQAPVIQVNDRDWLKVDLPHSEQLLKELGIPAPDPSDLVQETPA